jgi:cobalt/nickel transport system permease protein
MHVHFLDPYRHRSSPIHRMDARVKFFLAVAFILTAALVPSGAWPVYILLLSLVLSIEVLSELGVSYVLRRAVLALPFVLAAAPVIFTLDGPALFTFSLGPWRLAVSQPGLERFLSIAFKSWISVQAAILLATSTPFPDLLIAMRGLKVPRLMVSIFGLMWRYLFVLVDEALRLLRGRAARSSQSDRPGLKTGGGLAWRGRVAGGMAGNLFLRAFERSDRIYLAMLSRGYDGEARSLPLPGLKFSHWLIIGGSLALFAFLLAFAYVFWA